MKNVKYLLLLIVPLLLGSCDFSVNKTKLELGLEPGKTYTIQVGKIIKNIVEHNGEIKEINQKLVTGFAIVPVSVTDETLIKLEGKILSIDVVQEDILGRIEYNSAKDSISIPTLALPYSNLMGKSFIMMVMKNGTVISVEGMKPNLEKIFEGFDIPEEEIKKHLKDRIEEQFSDDAIKETFERMFNFYPEVPVQTGDTWFKEAILPNDFPITASNSYTLKERSNGIALINVSSRIKTDTVKIRKSPKLYHAQLIEGVQEGRLQIDEISGWITKAVFNYQVREVKYDSTAKTSTKEPRLISSEIKLRFEPLSSGVFREIEFNPAAVEKAEGFQMTIIGMGVVFCSLVLLFIVFSNLSGILNIRFRKKKPKDEKKIKEKKVDLTGEVSAAIGAALYLYFMETHDEENTVLTIKRVSRTYSPWSSKIYGLREPLRK
jgi:Na+-transporting methylmalonyl-CoA/oxaloacetate decarboxylase gamma subunit